MRDGLVQSVFNMAFYVVCTMPWVMAQLWKRAYRWQPPRAAFFLKVIALSLVLLPYLAGGVLWAIDHYGLLTSLGKNLEKLAQHHGTWFAGTIHWQLELSQSQRAVHHFIWTPILLRCVTWPMIWHLFFGPIPFTVTLWYLFETLPEWPWNLDARLIGTKKVSPRKMASLKRESRNGGVFLGASKSLPGTATVLPDFWRTSHAYCVGATRSGKTRSIMLPLALQDIERGHPVVIFDGKGDLEHLEIVAEKAVKCGRQNDLMLFSLAEPSRSHTYNPLVFGNATQKKDKIIGAFTWTEEHYKKMCEDTLLTVLLALDGTGERYNLEDLYLCLSEREAVKRVYELCKNPVAKEHLEYFYANFGAVTRDITGLVRDIGLIVKNEFWPLLDTYRPEIDFLDIIRRRKIVYLVLNTQAYQETAERLARLFLQDLRAASDYIQNKMPARERTFTPIYVDEFNSFAFDAFGDFMSKCGGARFALTIAHQSLGQLNKRGDHFKDEILDNANIKIILRQDNPAAVDEFARMIGTHSHSAYTYQTRNDVLFGECRTGVGTVRTVEEFNIDPNKIKRLQPHQAVVLIKQPFRYDILQLDVSQCEDASYETFRGSFPARNELPPRGEGLKLRAYLRERGAEGVGRSKTKAKEEKWRAE